MSFLTMLAPITVTGCRNGCSCIPRCIWSGYPSEVHNSTLWKPCGVGSNPKWLVTGPIPTSNPSKSRVGNNWINLRQSRLSENRGYLPERRDRTFDYLLSWTLSNLEMTAGEVKLKTIFVQRGLRCLTCPARL